MTDLLYNESHNTGYSSDIMISKTVMIKHCVTPETGFILHRCIDYATFLLMYLLMAVFSVLLT